MVGGTQREWELVREAFVEKTIKEEKCTKWRNKLGADCA